MSVKRKAGEALASEAKRPTSITSFFAPKNTGNSGNGPTNAVTPQFDKQAWAKKLTAEQRELLNLEIETLHESWFAVLKDELLKPSFLNLKRFLQKEKGKPIFPPEKDIYSWSRYTPLNTVKVVILGQDPYHGPNQAMGLSFSVRPPVPAPPSLQNIYKALKIDYPDFTPPPNRSGLLTPWAERGVLMLNACLTVRQSMANSHSGKGWEEFTQKVIDIVAKKRTSGVVFMAWGVPAGKRVTGIDQKRHLILKGVHPSPLSAARGFFDCGHFRKANDWLSTRYGDSGPIDWSLHGRPVGVPKSRVKDAEEEKKQSKPAPPETPKSVAKKSSIVPEDEEFDEDEEEAFMQATLEAEKLASSQVEPPSDAPTEATATRVKDKQAEGKPTEESVEAKEEEL